MQKQNQSMYWIGDICVHIFVKTWLQWSWDESLNVYRFDSVPVRPRYDVSVIIPINNASALQSIAIIANDACLIINSECVHWSQTFLNKICGKRVSADLRQKPRVQIYFNHLQSADLNETKISLISPWSWIYGCESEPSSWIRRYICSNIFHMFQIRKNEKNMFQKWKKKAKKFFFVFACPVLPIEVWK